MKPSRCNWNRVCHSHPKKRSSKWRIFDHLSCWRRFRSQRSLNLIRNLLRFRLGLPPERQQKASKELSASSPYQNLWAKYAWGHWTSRFHLVLRGSARPTAVIIHCCLHPRGWNGMKPCFALSEIRNWTISSTNTSIWMILWRIKLRKLCRWSRRRRLSSRAWLTRFVKDSSSHWKGISSYSTRVTSSLTEK